MDWGSFPWTWTLRGYVPEREDAPGAVNGVFRTSSNAVECAFGLLQTVLDSFQCCQMWSMGASRDCSLFQKAIKSYQDGMANKLGLACGAYRLGDLTCALPSLFQWASCRAGIPAHVLGALQSRFNSLRSPLASQCVCCRVHKHTLQHKPLSTAIGLRKYRIPSDLRSQAEYRLVSTTVGDHVGILGAVVFASHSDMFHRLGDLTCSSGGRPVEPRLAFGCGVGFFWTGGLSRELVI